jgi:acyl-CoA thioester hydrolase
MIQHETTLRVRYAETDQMGYVYYGNYFTYYEVGRVELIRYLGVTYKQLEENGVMLPVLEASCKYIRPARYDDYLTLQTTIKEKPGIRIKFDYELRNAQHELLNIGQTTLVFVNNQTMKPCDMPELMKKIMYPYFD